MSTFYTTPFESHSGPDVLPASFGQERLWFLDRLAPRNAAYNLPVGFRLVGPLHVAALKQSLNEIVRRHAILRTTLTSLGGRLVQVIAPTLALSVPVIDLRGLDDATREREIHRLASEEAQRPFELTRGPLFRATLLWASEEEHVLLLIMHHVISDGWSMGVFNDELRILYKAFCNSNPSPLPEINIQYADYAYWQREWLQGDVLENQLAYWKQRLSGELPVLELPTDRPRPSVQTFRGAHLSFLLPNPLTEMLKALCHQEGVTLFMMLLAAFQTLLQRHTGQEDILVGFPIANRNRAETERLIGFFVNTLVLRTDLSGNPTFRELLGRVREEALEAYAHQDLPFEKLVEALEPERDLSHNPLFQVMFALQNASTENFSLVGLQVSPLELESGTSQFDLTLSMEETAEGLKGTWEYDTDLFEAATIQRMEGHFQVLLEGIVASLDRRISDLPLLTEAERHQLLVKWNDTRTDYPEDKCLCELFEAQARRAPEAIAVAFEDQQLTYRELNRRANQLGHYLQKLGVGPEVLVGIRMERSWEMVVGLLGILKSGGAYVPLDSAYPKERLAFMLQDAQAPVLLTQQRLRSNLPPHRGRVICLDTDWQVVAQEDAENVDSRTIPDNLMYVIYTSGSTGRPKGAGVSQQGFVNLLHWFVKSFGLHSEDSTLVISRFGFDLTQKNFYAPLLVGGRVHIFPSERYDPDQIRQAIHDRQVTWINCTPSAFYPLVTPADKCSFAQLHSLRYVFLGGEPISMIRLRDWLASSLCKARIVNTYGPTECTDICTAYQVDQPEKFMTSSVPIGKPIYNAQALILDQKLGLLPAGSIGELCVAGTGLGRGYVGDRALTSAKFVPNPYSGATGQHVYRTGDLARYRPDGNIEFIGRIDNQVKIRGFRIELAEIEIALKRHPAVQEAAVVAWKERSDEKRLVAYVVPKTDHRIPNSELRGFLKEKLPEYMIPSAFVPLERMPLTSNGKVDLHALPTPDRDSQESRATYVAPRTRVEEQLAKIWAEILGVQRVGIHENFFELGGHSLMALQVVAKASQNGIPLTLQEFMGHPVISELVQAIGSRAIKAEQGLVAGKTPCLPQQVHMLDIIPDVGHRKWTTWIMVESSRRLTPSLVEKTFRHLVTHHDALRTRFVHEEGEWQQVFAEAEKAPVSSWFDLSELPDRRQEDAIRTIATDLSGQINFLEGPVIQAAAFDLGTQRSQQILVIVSHFVCDGVSLDILMEDLEATYLQLERGEATNLGAKTTSVRDYAERLSQYAKTVDFTQTLSRWLNMDLGQVGQLSERLCESTELGQVLTLITKEETWTLMRQVPTIRGTRVIEVLLTALALSIRSRTGKPALLLRTVRHNRDPFFEDVDLSRTVGLIRVWEMLNLNLGLVESPQDALATIRSQLQQPPDAAIGFYLARYFSGETAVAKKLGQCFDNVQVHLNFRVLSRTLDETLLFATIPAPDLPRPPVVPVPCVFINADVDSNGQLHFLWSYSRRYHTDQAMQSLAEEYLKVLKSLIASEFSNS